MSDVSVGRICPMVLGIALAVVWGLSLFLLSLTSAFIVHSYGSSVIALLSTVYVGYDASVSGAFIGLAWGFVDFFIFGFLIAFVFNRLISLRSHHSTE